MPTHPHEREILTFLKPIKDFVTHQEIGKAVGGRKRFRENPHWAKPVLLTMVAKGSLEMSDLGHFKFKKQDDARKPPVHLSPAIAQALEESGREFDLTAVADLKPEPKNPRETLTRAEDDSEDARNKKLPRDRDPRGDSR